MIVYLRWLIRTIPTCSKCGSASLGKNGSDQGVARYQCKDCNFQGRFSDKTAQRATKYQQVEQLLLERNSQRSITRLTGVWRPSIAKLTKKVMLPSDHSPHPVLEMDELWSYVGSKDNPVWIWLALEVRSRRIVSIALGDRSEQMAQQLYEGLPAYYQQQGVFFTDAWKSYHILSNEQHFTVNRSTNHIERFNGTLRQRCTNLVRKTLSFSKSFTMHQQRIFNFINHYNFNLSP